MESNSVMNTTQLTSAPVDSVEAPPKSILLVDDSFVLRDRLALAFEERGFRVAVAGSYDEAIAVFRQHPTDLAVLDLRMPGRPGMALIPELKKLNPDTKILVLSGFGSIATAIDAMRLGATNFLPKPADADDILNAFARVGSEVEIPQIEEEIPVPTLAQAEWEHIHRVLADCGGNISEAARRLGIHRRSLQRKLRKRAP
jgi:two-component system response regulator RegA